MSPEQQMVKKKILEMSGFDTETPQAHATINEIYKTAPVSLTNRVDAFITDDLRRKCFHAKKESVEKRKTNTKAKSVLAMSESAMLEVANAGYEAQKNKVLYTKPVPVVPYAHVSKQVTPHGFIRDDGYNMT